MRFVPSFKVFACKHGNADLVYDVLLSFVIMGRIFLVSNDENTDYDQIRAVIIASFVFIVLGYTVIFVSRPYYNSYQHKLKCFQILYLLCLIGFSILVRETNFIAVRNENSAMIFLCLTLTVLLKANNNLSKFNIPKLISKTKNQKTISTRDLLTIFYLIQNYVKSNLLDDTGATSLQTPLIVTPMMWHF
jgi:hypothetical protein